MRTLLKVTMDLDSGNKAIIDGSMQKIIQNASEKLKPEAAYFLPDKGERCCMMIFDMQDSSEIPAIVEPFFLNLKAKVELIPVMNADDLKKGLEAAMKERK